MMEIDILKIVEIAEEAGRAVMEVYSKDFTSTLKDDRSPLTEADMASHRLIERALNELTPEMPVLSEESKAVPFEVRNKWQRYWIVDPLDGTKEFIKRNGEFTVNIAMIESGSPVLGVVHAPARHVTYYAAEGNGAYRKSSGQEPVKTRVSGPPDGVLKIVGSRSHGGGEALERLLSSLGPHELVGMGSSLKLCLVADGTAHLYPRLGPTMEWDTAAAQCVVEEAGGSVIGMDGKRLRYNKENLLNGNFFVACGEEIIKKVIGMNKPGNGAYVVWHHATVTRARRQAQNGHKSVILWFTGLSGAGKSTLAHAVEEKLHRLGCRTYVFDGDNVRHGLNSNLGFSKEDRKENIRRIGEMCKLFVDAGVIALTAFISPFREDRENVRRLVPQGDFIEVFCDCPLELCERRDVKGMYAKARRGEIKEFTGISSPYEEPEDAELMIDTGTLPLEVCVEKIVSYLLEKNVIKTLDGSRGTAV